MHWSNISDSHTTINSGTGVPYRPNGVTGRSTSIIKLVQHKPLLASKA